MDLLTPWEFVADRVMGGVSSGRMEPATIQGRDTMRLTGDVSLDNNGGFVQMAFDVASNVDGGGPLDASGFSALEADVFGNDETYDLRLRTTELSRPWQSYRADFFAPARWTTVRIPLSDFKPHKTEVPFDPRLIRRIGILAIGREFRADIAVAAVRLCP